MHIHWWRLAAGGAGFAAAAILGIVIAGGIPEAGEPDPVFFAFQAVANVLALILAVAVIVGVVAYLAVEYASTRRLETLSRQFTTRTLVLIPFAIALNILMGQTVFAVLKLPIYLDSIGTILVGVLAGPLAGAATGFLANILWSYVLPAPFQNPPAAAFAVVAAVIGLLAGTYGRIGLLAPRTNRSFVQLGLVAVIAAVVIGGLGWLGYLGYTAIGNTPSLTPGEPSPNFNNPLFLALGWIALAVVAGAFLGLVALLLIRRDLTAGFVVLCGAITGVVAGLISAPIAAGVFGGVTGAGTDFLVLAFRQAGVDVAAATLGQSLISDPIDKITTFFVVYLILQAMARRTTARFPQGERLLEGDEVEGSWQRAPA
jgi:energy-coupling factor transport system substrate-specific component